MLLDDAYLSKSIDSTSNDTQKHKFLKEIERKIKTGNRIIDLTTSVRPIERRGALQSFATEIWCLWRELDVEKCETDTNNTNNECEIAQVLVMN